MSRHEPEGLLARRVRALAATALLLAVASCQLSGTRADWRPTLRDELPRYGHRNFVVVADAAYPLQVNPGVRTLLADGAHLDVVDTVLEEIAASPHVRPVVWLDAELEHVPEADAPGVERLRTALTDRLAGLEVRRAPHEEIIRRLDETADLYEVLLLKTDMVIPYSSVFVELQCGYWESEAEEALRESMARAEGR